MISIIYRDVSLTAKDDSTPSCNDKQSFSNLNLLKQSGLTFKKFATLEKDFWKLNGTFKDFPNDPTQENFALWSESISGEDGRFTNPIQLIIDFSSYETCVGLTFDFSVLTNDYPDSINVKWYQDTTLLSEKDYTSDNSQYFCENGVTGFNKIEIVFNSMNNPYRYLKLQEITYGIIRTFDEDELRSVELLEDLSLTSEELKINTLNFTLSNKKMIDFIFQKKQPLTIMRNDDLLGTFFIDSSKRKNEKVYEISAIDYIGVLDKMPFASGTYTNEMVSNLVSSIMGNIPYELDSTFNSMTLSGTLEACTRREALLQVAFAICAVVDTSRSNVVKIFSKVDTVTETLEDGIYTGENFGIQDEVTEVRLQLNDGTVLAKKNPLLGADTLDNVLEFSGVFIGSSNGQAVLNYLYDFYVTNKNNKTNMKFIVTDEKPGDMIQHITEYMGTKKGQIAQMKFTFNSNKFVAQTELKDME